MKQIAFLLLAATLGGCLVVTPTPEPQPPVLEVLSATYSTDFQDETTGAFYICDNRSTTLTYSFTYQGQLESWSSYLKGQRLGQTKGERTFEPGGRGVVSTGEQGFEVQYVMSPNFAPYAQGNAEVSPQAIVVVPTPNDPIGATKLYLTLKGANGDARPYSSQDIPVINNCP